MVSTRSSAGATTNSALPDTPAPTTKQRRSTPAPSTTTTTSSPTATTATITTTMASKAWSHTPSTTTLAWLAISIPLVLWDTGYVLLRPHSMPGGSLHWPLWTPYALYGTVDHMYGFKQWEAHNGFTAAQSWLNVVETAMYVWYLALWYRHGVAAAGQARPGVAGRAGALCAVLGLSVAVMTVSKTVLYWLNEGFSGFDNIGHNSAFDLVLMWIIPNGAWLVGPSIMIYEIGSDILDGLTAASGQTLKIE